MSKNTWRKLLVLAIVCLIPVGVSSMALGASKQKTITWWVPNWDEPVAKELVAEFAKTNPDIEVKMVITTWDTMADKIRVALMGGSPPDIITELESRVSMYAAKGLLTCLDAFYVREGFRDDFVPSSLATVTYKDSLYGVPFRHDGSGMFYNREMFREAGLDPDEFPMKWDEFIALAKKLTKDTDGDGVIDQYGMAWPFGNQANAVVRFMIMLYSHGGEVVDESETKCLLDSPQAIAAMKDLTDTIILHKVAPQTSLEIDNTGLRALFTNRRIAMFIDGSYSIDAIKEEAPDLDFGTAPMPGPEGMATTTCNGFALIIPERAKNVTEAERFAAFIAKVENMSRLTNSFPARRSAMDDPKFSSPLLKPHAQQLEKGHAEPSFTRWPETERIIYTYMQRILLGEMDADTAMRKATVEIDKILK